MKHYYIILIGCVIVCATLGAQENDKILSAHADSAYASKDYEQALDAYSHLITMFDKKDETYKSIILKYAKSMYFTEIMYRDDQRFKESLSLAKAFMKLLSAEQENLEPFAQKTKYWMLKNEIVDYFGLGYRDSAKQYQDTLYMAYKNKLLPDGLEKYYNFEFFKLDTLNIWGYEWYPELGDPETMGSYSKQVYFVITTDDKGHDKQPLYTLETVKIHKFDNTIKNDYVLTKRYVEQGRCISETIWSVGFISPVDYAKLHDAVVAVVKGKIKPSGTYNYIK
jgi:tetratricopeptide (TPR) repeat protein